jgi:hypothetical protein
LEAAIADRGYKGLRAQLARHGIKLDIKQPPTPVEAVVPDVARHGRSAAADRS